MERRKVLGLKEEEKNVDEFNKLFKEVKWMKKALDKELAQVQTTSQKLWA